MITTGVTGSTWRASITPWGGLVPWDGPPLEWYVAADDRWHVPAAEAAVRQRRVEGTPVTETRLRVPNGDVVQRVYSVVDGGGVTVVEVENESTLPVAVAFDRRDVLTERAIATVPVEGIDLPSTAFVLPLGHRATVRIGVPHRPATGEGRLPGRLPSATQVVRGWTTLTERAGRLVLPEGASGALLAERVVAERCDLALGVVPHAVDDPVGYCIGLGELVRMGERPDHWLPELVAAVAAVGPLPGWHADVALAAADRILAAAGERRARRDLDRIVARRTAAPRPVDPPTGIALVPWLEGLLVRGRALFPDGLPSGWLGQPVEGYGLPTDGAAVSFAIRWHGSRPAVLWEQSGGPVELTAPVLAPGWATSAASGEALLPDPPGAPTAPPAVPPTGPPGETSFT